VGERVPRATASVDPTPPDSRATRVFADAPQAPFAQRLTPLRCVVLVRSAQFDRTIAVASNRNRRVEGSGQGRGERDSAAASVAGGAARKSLGRRRSRTGYPQEATFADGGARRRAPVR